MQIETVDQIIRKKARARLQAEMQALTAALRARFPAGGLELTHFVDGQGRRTTARGALDEIQATLFKHEIDAYEQAAVDKFIASHETLQASLDQLKVEAAPIGETRSENPHASRPGTIIGHDYHGGDSTPDPGTPPASGGV